MPKLTPDPVDIPSAGRLGKVLTAPANLTAPLRVSIEGFDKRYVYEVHRWMPRGDALPSAGDEVLVIEDDTGDPWVVAWWPG